MKHSETGQKEGSPRHTALSPALGFSAGLLLRTGRCALSALLLGLHCGAFLYALWMLWSCRFRPVTGSRGKVQLLCFLDVLVCQGCRFKASQTGCSSLMVLEAASLRSGYQQDWFLLRGGGEILLHASAVASGGLLATCGIPWLLVCFHLTWLSDAQRADKTLFLVFPDEISV